MHFLQKIKQKIIILKGVKMYSLGPFENIQFILRLPKKNFIDWTSILCDTTDFFRISIGNYTTFSQLFEKIFSEQVCPLILF